MEHPYLFFVKLFELFGLGHFAHEFPHVIYTWVVMALLIVLGSLAAKNVSLIPSKMQNVFELLISGMEDFMIEITGEEGRWLFPMIATIFIYIFACNLIGLIPGFFSAHRKPQHHPVLRFAGGDFHPSDRREISRRRLYQAFPRAGMVDDSHHLSHRGHRTPGPHLVPVIPVVSAT